MFNKVKDLIFIAIIIAVSLFIFRGIFEGKAVSHFRPLSVINFFDFQTPRPERTEGCGFSENVGREMAHQYYSWKLRKTGQPLFSWNPDNYCGYPQFANTKSSFLAPLFNLSLLITDDFFFAYQLQIFLAYMLGAVFMYIFLRVMRIEPTWALLGGLAVAYSDSVFRLPGNICIVGSVFWIPLIGIAIVKYSESVKFRYLLLLVATLLCQYTSAFIEMVMYVWGIAFLWLIYVNPHRYPRKVLEPIWLFASATLMITPLLFTTAELIGRGYRSKMIGHVIQTPLTWLYMFYPHFQEIWLNLNPKFLFEKTVSTVWLAGLHKLYHFDFITKGFYGYLQTISCTILLVIPFWKLCYPNKHIRFLTYASAVILIFPIIAPFLRPLLIHLPLINGIEDTTRIYKLFPFTGITIGLWSMQGMLATPGYQRILKRLLYLVMLVIGILLAVDIIGQLLLLLPAVKELISTALLGRLPDWKQIINIERLLPLIGLLLTLWLLLKYNPGSKYLIKAGITAVFFVVFFWYAGHYAIFDERPLLNTSSPIVKFIQNAGFNGRIAAYDPVMQESYNLFNNLNNVSGGDSIFPAQIFRKIEALDQTGKYLNHDSVTCLAMTSYEPEVINQLGINFVLIDHPVQAKHLRFIGYDHGIYGYQNLTAWPRFFLYNQEPKPEDMVDSEQPIRVIKYSNNELELETSANSPKSLALLEAYYPGWHAYVNDKEVAISKYQDVFRSIKVPAGIVRIKFHYRPTAFSWVFYLAGCGLLMLSGLYAFTYNNKQTVLKLCRKLLRFSEIRLIFHRMLIIRFRFLS